MKFTDYWMMILLQIVSTLNWLEIFIAVTQPTIYSVTLTEETVAVFVIARFRLIAPIVNVTLEIQDKKTLED